MKKLLVILSLFVSSYCFAAPSNNINVPNSFSPNTVIQSAQTNANNSEIQSKYNAHTHTDITQLGTVTTGGWNASIISTQYGGTGKDFSSGTSGSILYFDNTGSIGYVPQSYVAGSAPKDVIARGFEIVTEVPNATRCIVNSGILYNGLTKVEKTSGTIITLTTAADWSSGSVVSYGGGAGWNYIGCDVSGNIKYLGALNPNRSDSAGNNQGTQYYAYDGSLYWRIIGALRINTSNQVSIRYFQHGDYISLEDPQTDGMFLNGGASTSYASVSLAAFVPRISSLISFSERTNGSGADIWYKATNTVGTSGYRATVTDTNVQLYVPDVPTNSSQSIDYRINADNVTCYLTGYKIDTR